MQRKDQSRFSYTHAVELASDPGLPSRISDAIAIGWLGRKASRRGRVDSDTCAQLRLAVLKAKVDTGELGYHECGICRKHEERGEIAIPYAEGIFVAPRMILHYIEEHGYVPPEDFIEALRRWHIDHTAA